MNLKIISGGQTGVDQAGLRAARACGLETGGWAPRGWMTTEGPAPWLAGYGLEECEIPGYPARTKRNVCNSDATLFLGNPLTSGAQTTLLAVATHGVPSYLASAHHLGQSVAVRANKGQWTFWVRDPAPSAIAKWIRRINPKVLNVAGNRESRNEGIGAAAETLLTKVFTLLQKEPRP